MLRIYKKNRRKPPAAQDWGAGFPPEIVFYPPSRPVHPEACLPAQPPCYPNCLPNPHNIPAQAICYPGGQTCQPGQTLCPPLTGCRPSQACRPASEPCRPRTKKSTNK